MRTRHFWLSVPLAIYGLAMPVALAGADCPLEQILPSCPVSCPIWGGPNETRDCKDAITPAYDPYVFRVIGSSCLINSSSCQESATLCKLPAGPNATRNATQNCPDPCSQGGCPTGYTHNCQGDQEPDPNFCHCCVNYSPILIHLGTGHVRLSDAAAGVFWDINGLGSVLRVAWPLDPNDDVFLVRDRDGNGAVDNGTELFGNTTPLRDGGVASNGYEALAELDANGDTWVDSVDPAFSILRLWRDSNRNGVAEEGELVPLQADGVLRLSTVYHESGRRDRFGNRFRFRAKVESSSTPHEKFSYDVFPVTER